MTPKASLVQRHWPTLALALFILGVALIGFPSTRHQPANHIPNGWHLTPETGQTFALIVDGESVWAGGKDGVFKIDRKTGNLIEHLPLDSKVAMVRSLAVSPAGDLWIGHTNGLTQIKDGVATTFGEEDGLPGLRVNALLQEGGTLWIGTSGGLATLVDGKPAVSSLSANLITPVVNVLFQDRDLNLWVGSSSTPSGGITVISKSHAEHLSVKSGLPHPYVQGITQDSSGAVWVATGQYEEGGVAKFEPSKSGWSVAQVLHKGTGLAGAKARSITYDGHGALWIGSESDGLAVRNGSDSRIFTTKDGLPHNEVTAIRADRDGNVWLATLRGVVRIRADVAAEIGHGLREESKQ